ncbi:unnamed protein product [Gadus morhua 'NCC']
MVTVLMAPQETANQTKCKHSINQDVMDEKPLPPRDYTPYGEMELERGAVVDGADALRLMDERQWPPPRGVAWERPPKQEFGEALLACEHSDNPGETSIPTQGLEQGMEGRLFRRSTAGHIVEDVFREWDQSVCQTQIIRYQAPETERVEQANLPLEKEPSMYRQKESGGVSLGEPNAFISPEGNQLLRIRRLTLEASLVRMRRRKIDELDLD